jgi:hypothetical protein
MKGIITNIVNEFSFRKATEFQSALADICGPIDFVSIAKDSFHFTVHCDSQKYLLLSTKSILNIDVSVTLPKSITSITNSNVNSIPNPKLDPKPFLYHGVIKVPHGIEIEHIKEATKTGEKRHYWNCCCRHRLLSPLTKTNPNRPSFLSRP